LLSIISFKGQGIVRIEFKDIAEPFAHKGLSLPTLNVLVPDARPYEVLVIQPSGLIDARANFVGHANRDLAIQKFSEFIDLAIAKAADLVLSPEYSCPWDVLKDCLRGGKFPALGKLWVLGCESITPTEFRDLVASFPDFTWVHEELPDTAGDFLGVVCYFLKTNSEAGLLKNVVVAQFKTVPMQGQSSRGLASAKITSPAIA
jgi:hypothetical protein